MKQKIIIVTNIPTPYRNSLYKSLHDWGLNIEVLFQRETEDGRYWRISDLRFNFPHLIFSGLYFKLERFHFHFVPTMLNHLMSHRDSKIVIGLGWNEIDTLFLILLKKLRFFRGNFYFWSEANYLTYGARKDNFLKKIYRKFIYNTNGCTHLISGKMTELTLNKWGVSVKNYVQFPNIIEEEIFHVTNNEVLCRRNNELPIFVVPIRLLERDKGLINYLTALGVDNIKKAVFMIAGDGEDRLSYLKFIVENELTKNVILLGHLSSSEMRELYSKSNVLLLPSLSDPSPLSVFEAMAMRLPILISYRCGNHFEALFNSINGFGFDPQNKDEIIDSFLRIIKNRDKFEDMGHESFVIYSKNFTKKIVINNLISSLSV
jgi:glycosyltransferase involved in cell wall biosynthesis